MSHLSVRTKILVSAIALAAAAGIAVVAMTLGEAPGAGAVPLTLFASIAVMTGLLVAVLMYENRQRADDANSEDAGAEVMSEGDAS